MPRARVRVPGRTQKKRQCRVRRGRAGRSTFHKIGLCFCPGGAGVRAVLREMAASLSAAARGVSDTLHSHRAACSPRGALRGGSAAAGSAGIVRGAGRNGQGAALPSSHTRPGSTGAPPLVRIRTDTFLRREKCPRCRVRGCVSPGGRKRNDNAACGGAGPGEALFTKLAFAFARAARGCGQFCAKWPRPCPPPHARIRTLCPAAKVFASRRTTRRQCRVWLGFHRAAGGEKPARAPPCLAGLLIQARETPPSRGEARPSPRSAHRNGHFSLS